MMLEDLIAALEGADPHQTVQHGFTNPHSYRGYYHELAFEPAANVTVREMLADARSALGATYQGWKGGDFTMDAYTDCWLAEEGSTGETLGPLLLELMLATPGAPREPRPALVDDGQWSTIRSLVGWLDSKNGRSDHEIAMRTLKVTEEAGEVAAAYLGVHGQNPRKGNSHAWADVMDELADVIVTASVALATITDRPQEVLDAKLAKIAARSGVNT